MKEAMEIRNERSENQEIKSKTSFSLFHIILSVCAYVLSVYRRPWILITFQVLCVSCEHVFVCVRVYEEWVVG